MLTLYQTEHDWLQDELGRTSLHSARRKAVRLSLASAHPHIPQRLHSTIFPLYHPSSLDCFVCWEIPSHQSRGYILVQAGELGASHSALRAILSAAKEGKANRSIFAETQNERQEMLDAIDHSVWNMEMNPIVVTVPDVQVTHDFTANGCVVLDSLGIQEANTSAVLAMHL
jgi:trafficking protein particle complex subunit 8